MFNRLPPDSTFVALDFETANRSGDSACSVGLVRVENQKVIRTAVHLINPPEGEFLYTHIHGLTREQVQDAPHFGGVWPEIRTFFEDIDFIAGHNVGFDLKVLYSCASRFGIELPTFASVCTVQLARRTWNIFPTKLPDVCRALQIELKHHEALSDAMASAQIVLAALTHQAQKQQQQNVE